MSAPVTTPDPGTVESSVSDGVGTIRFGHPKGNSLPAALLRALARAVDALAADPAARVIVLRSEGTGAFCGGASFDELRAVRDAGGGKEFFMGFARLILAMRRAPKFVIARVQGRAVGGGVGVVAASDMAIAHRSASVRLSELAIGIGPFVVGPAIERRIGPGPFQALAMDATAWRDAAWGERHGLYAQVVEAPHELDDVVDALARRLAASSPDAMARMKTVFWEGTEGWDELLERRAEISGGLVAGEFAQGALRAMGG
jgi:methylglutaconyl-CoA hydratase